MLVDLTLNVLLGLVLGLVARDRLRVHGPFAFPAIHILSIFVAMVILPAVVYFHLAHPAWTWMYLVNPDGLSAIWRIGAIVLHVASVYLGWFAAALVLRHGQILHLIYTIVGAALVCMIALLLGKNRLGTYGNYGDYIDGRALPLWEVKLGYVLVLMSIGVLVGFAFTVFELHKDGRRVRNTQRMNTVSRPETTQ